MRIIRPNEPEFNYHELFPGNLQPSPVAAKNLDPETVRTAINCYRDNFNQQKRFDREMNAALAALLGHLNLLWKVVVVEALAIIVVLAVAISRR